MLPNEYQELAAQTEIYSKASFDFVANLFNRIEYEGAPPDNNFPEYVWLQLAYCTGKLNGEAGETAEIVFKAFRDEGGEITDQNRILLAKELGDVLWYVARIADLLEYDLETIMQMNIEKLEDRKNRDALHGYGNER